MKTIRSPPGLHYPITVVELVQKKGAEIQRSTPLFKYYYVTTVTEGDKYGDTKEIEKRFPARFDASADGKLERWYIQNGAVIQRAG